MSKEFLSDVRDQLASRSTRTSLTELRDRGMQQVRVIRSSQILQLIEEAVDRAMADRGYEPSETDRAAVLAQSQEIFQGMMSGGAGRQGPSMELLEEQQLKLEQSVTEAESLRRQLVEKEADLQEALTTRAELDAKLRVLHQRAEAAAPDAVLEELKALRSEIRGGSGTRAPQGDSSALQERLDDLGKELNRELQRIGQKVGIKPVEEVSDLSSLFNSGPELESNLDSVEAKESAGANVEEALARMKSLRKR